MVERRVSVRVTANGSDFSREFNKLVTDVTKLKMAIGTLPETVTVRGRSAGFSDIERDAQRAARSGSILVDTLGMLAPTIAPISATAVAGFGALSAQAAAAVGSIAPLLLATNGLGDALDALDTARLEPTVENLQAVDKALSGLPEQTAAFARRLSDLRPLVARFQDTSAAGMFPGVNAGLDALLSRSDEVETVLGRLAEAQGELARRTGEDLAGPEWDAFFEMVERDAKPTLLDLGSTIGSLGSALANVATGLSPLNREIGAGIADWADNLERLSRTADYDAFMEYVRENGPQVLDTLGALGAAVVDLTMAAGAIGGPTLKIIEAVASSLSAIADSPAGPVLFTAAAGLAAFNRAQAVSARLRDTFAADFIRGTTGRGSVTSASAASILATGRAAERSRISVRRFGRDFHNAMVPVALSAKQLDEVRASQARVRTAFGNAAKGAGGLAAFAAVSTGASESLRLTNALTLGLAGSMAGPYGAAAGAAIGATLDLKEAYDGVAESIDSARRALGTSSGSDVLATELTNLRKARDAANDTVISRLFDGDLVGAAQSASVMDIYADALEAVAFRAKDGQGAIDATNQKLADTRAADLARASQVALSQGYTLTADAARRARDGALGLDQALARGSNALGKFAAQESYRSSLAGFTAALKENGRTLDANTDKGRANRAQLQAIAGDALALAARMPKDQQLVFLQRAREEVIGFAQQAKLGQEEAQRLADRLGLFEQATFNPQVLLDTKTADDQRRYLEGRLNLLGKMVQTPRVRAETTQAQRMLELVKARIDAITSKRISVTTVYREEGVVRQTGVGALTRKALADGGTVPGARYPYGDKVLAYLAPGEEVITNRNGEADRFRLDRAMGRIPAYADGGMVQAYAAAARPSYTAPSVNVAAPVVTATSPGVQVFIDGREVEAIVRQVNEADARHAAGARIGR